MSRIGDHSLTELGRMLRGPGIRLKSAELAIRIWSDVPEIRDHLATLYTDHELLAVQGIDDYRVRISWSGGLQGLLRRQVASWLDSETLFVALPRPLSPFFVEGCLNWCLGFDSPGYVALHGGVIERDGRATILPALSGSGKSTLCAALVNRGWRLLSDELTMIRPQDGKILALGRPISLKNDAIDVIRHWAPEAQFGALLRNGPKGDVAYMRPPTDSVRRVGETASPTFIVAPLYQSGAAADLAPIGRSEAFKRMVDGAILYRTTGRTGFETTSRLIEACPAYRLTYGKLDEALALFEDLYAKPPEQRYAPVEMASGA